MRCLVLPPVLAGVLVVPGAVPARAQDAPLIAPDSPGMILLGRDVAAGAEGTHVLVGTFRARVNGHLEQGNYLRLPPLPP